MKPKTRRILAQGARDIIQPLIVYALLRLAIT
jgi:hypothetical protein